MTNIDVIGLGALNMDRMYQVERIVDDVRLSGALELFFDWLPLAPKIPAKGSPVTLSSRWSPLERNTV